LFQNLFLQESGIAPFLRMLFLQERAMKSFRVFRIHLILFLLLTVMAVTAFPGRAYAQSGRKTQRPATTTDPKSGKTAPEPEKPSATLPGSLSDVQVVTEGEESVIKVGTTLVSIPTSVVDRNGQYVPFIEKKEFHIYEDGIEQKVEDFRTMRTPAHIALMLDTSGSTAFRLEDIQEAAIAFTRQLRDDDKVMVVSFDSKIYLDSEFTSDRAILQDAIRRTKSGGSTRLYDAIDLVVNERMKQIDGRKAIVLFTDGWDTSSRETARGIVRMIEESDIVVYVIRYDTQHDPYQTGGGPTIGGTPPIGGRGRGPTSGSGGTIGFPFPIPGSRNPQPGSSGPVQNGTEADYRHAATFLQTLASHSGGRLYNADRLLDVSSAFARIAEELGYQYALTYYPTNAKQDGSWRRVKVRVDRSDLIVRAREGYRAKGGTEAVAEKEPKGKRPTLQKRKLQPSTQREDPVAAR
jgi:VWFA-related protein